MERPSQRGLGESQKLEQIKVEKTGRDALFMGLGDVIFPGMLVISATHILT